MLAKSLIKR